MLMFFLWLEITVLFSVLFSILLIFEPPLFKEYKLFCSFDVCQICLIEKQGLVILPCSEAGVLICKKCNYAIEKEN